MSIEQANQTGILKLIAKPGSLGFVGGFARYKQWAEERRHAFTIKGRAFRLTPPRGQLIVGFPGTGKSLAAKAIADHWELPLYWLDIGSILGSYLGQSEANLRQVYNEAANHSPCVIWIDELDRSLSVGSENDAGVTSRMVASLLTWLQERQESVFISATANRVTSLPVELVRPGRFDLIWGVDLPGFDERIEIIRIHLRARQRDPETYNLESFAFVTDRFVGAEIEATIIDAFYLAYLDKSNLRDVHLQDAAIRRVAQASRYEDELKLLREWMEKAAIDVGD